MVNYYGGDVRRHLFARANRATAFVFVINVFDLIGKLGLEFFTKILDRLELSRYHQFIFKEDRWCYAVAHAIKKILLASYLDEELAGIRFKNNPYGKPEVFKAIDLDVSLKFNISHSSGCVAIVLSDTLECGLDIEKVRCASDLVGVMNNVFSAAEIEHVMTSEGESRDRLFFHYWTLKEAYAKARGFGFSLDFKAFGFRVSPEGSVTLDFDNIVGVEPWSFDSFSIANSHVLSIAIMGSNIDIHTRYLTDDVVLGLLRGVTNRALSI